MSMTPAGRELAARLTAHRAAPMPPAGIVGELTGNEGQVSGEQEPDADDSPALADRVSALEQVMGHHMANHPGGERS